MSTNSTTNTLEAHMYSAFPILRIESDEEQRIIEQVLRAAQQVGKELVTWSIASGAENPGSGCSGYKMDSLKMVDYEEHTAADDSTEKPETILRSMRSDIMQSIVVLLDFHPYLEKPQVVRLLKEAAFRAENAGNKIVLLSHAINVPAELAKLTEDYSVELPDIEQISQLVDQEAALYAVRRKDKSIKVDENAKALLINNLVGVSLSDAQRLIKNAICIDGAIDSSDIPAVKRAKYRLISKAGALTFEYDTSSFDEIGGFHNLKEWINKRKNGITSGRATGSSKKVLDRPKGVLLLGVQGCGKSLAARAIAGQLGIPLVRLDISALFNKYIGESERNMREALQTAKTMSPCVLWVDEIEKGITGGNDNSGASQRMLGYLLSWMQENDSGTFLVATANDITSLPPELMRKGRIDEIFFVDLPTAKIRQAILENVLRKRGVSLINIDLSELVSCSEGFSGAELEQAVVAALYSSSGNGAELQTGDVVDELLSTRPLSVVRDEEIQALRDWASTRTVNVDQSEDDDLVKLPKAS